LSSVETDNTRVTPKAPEQLRITFTEGKLRGGKDGFAYGKPFAIRFKVEKSREFLSNENKVDIRVYAVYNKNCRSSL